MRVGNICMLSWMCSVIRPDRIRNEYIRGRLVVTDITEKTREKIEMVWTGQEKNY